jgi:hypothetical protein
MHVRLFECLHEVKLSKFIQALSIRKCPQHTAHQKRCCCSHTALLHVLLCNMAYSTVCYCILWLVPLCYATISALFPASRPITQLYLL